MCDHCKPLVTVQSYTIEINEFQRRALLTLITQHPELTADNAALDFWPDMLAELPQVEAAHPGVVHGFCL